MILPQIILPLLLQINRMIIGRFKHEIPLQTFNRIFIEANSVETNHSSSFCTELTNTLSFSLIDAA